MEKYSSVGRYRFRCCIEILCFFPLLYEIYNKVYNASTYYLARDSSTDFFPSSCYQSTYGFVTF
jgi:hypothetical protein